MRHLVSNQNDLAPEIERKKLIEANTRHLLDLASERARQKRRKNAGYGWKTHNIPPETARPFRNYSSSCLSMIGSSGQMCADLGVTV